MKRFLLLLALFTVLISSRGGAAQYPLGSVAAKFTYIPSKLLADPVRNRVYVTDVTSNSVIVIDTTTLKVIAAVPIGSDPVDMAISRDGNTLYVANSGSTLAAIGVLNLNTLTAPTSFSLPGSALAVAAGLSGRLYAAVSAGQGNAVIYQLDGSTGAVQATFNQGFYNNNFLQISPDGTTLFVASSSIDPGSLESFDVSTPTAAALQSNTSASENDSQLVISHNGKYLCLPSGGGNPGAPGYSTLLFSTANINASFGSFSNGPYPGPLAFSPDDSLVYQTRYGGDPVVDEFNTQTFTKIQEVSLPSVGEEGYPDSVNTMVADNTGSYLFIAELSSDGVTNTGQLAVVTTGSGTLTPVSVLPVITSSLAATATAGTPATYQIIASGNPTSYGATGLPPGLAVNTTTGLISGTPMVSGYYYSTITASNASGTATATLDIEVDLNYSPPGFTTNSLPEATAGSSYSFAVVATGSPYAYSASGLPAGLSQDSSSGLISGIPTQSGVFTVTLQATNANGEALQTVSLTVEAPVPVINSNKTAAGTFGIAFAYKVAATNTPTSFTASRLPSGLSLNPSTGVISGVPATVGAYSVGLSAANAYGTGTATLVLTIVYPVPVITSSRTASGQMDEPFAYQLVASYAPTRFAASGLPLGLAINSASGLISGKPAVAGTFLLTLTATNATGVGKATVTLAVAALVQPAIISARNDVATKKEPFSYQIIASNTPTSYSATGLPPGLRVNTATGLISGEPMAIGKFVVHLAAANAAGVGSAPLDLTVAEELPVVTLIDTIPSVLSGDGSVGRLTVKLSTALNRQVIVHYRIQGSAVNGTDYELLTGTLKFNPGKRSKPIKIIPLGDLDGAKDKLVKIRLETGPEYKVGTTVPLTVTIHSGD